MFKDSTAYYWSNSFFWICSFSKLTGLKWCHLLLAAPEISPDLKQKCRNNIQEVAQGELASYHLTMSLIWSLTWASSCMPVWSLGMHCRSSHVPLAPTPSPHGQHLRPPHSHQPSTHFCPGQPPFEGWVINVPSDTPSGHRGSPGGHRHRHTHTHVLHTHQTCMRTCMQTRRGDPSNGVNWPSVAVSYVLVYDGDPKVTPKRPSCAVITIPSSAVWNWMHHKTNPKDDDDVWL